MMNTQLSQLSTITPPVSPRSFLPLSTSPELVRETFCFLQEQATTTDTDLLPYEVRLTRDEYELLERTIFGDPRTDESHLHWDWYPPRDGQVRGRFVVPMPSVAHDEFRNFIRDALANSIAAYKHGANNAAACEAASKLRPSSDTNIKRGKTLTPGYPDAAFKYDAVDMKRRTYPLLIEVSYSQSAEDLREKARLWLNTRGVKTIITFNLPYQGPDARKTESTLPYSPTYTVYRAPNETNDNRQAHQVRATFCTAAKEAEDGQLELTLNDFIPDAHLLDSNSNQPIIVSHSDLTCYLTAALGEQAKDDLEEFDSESETEKKSITMESDGNPSPSQGSLTSSSASNDRKSDKDWPTPKKGEADLPARLNNPSRKARDKKISPSS